MIASEAVLMRVTRQACPHRVRGSRCSLLYLIVQGEIWYDLPGTLRGLTGGDRRLYLPSGVMNQVYDTKNRVVKA